MWNTPINILLADDDTDDCLFFKEALEELPVSTHLTTVHDGEQLMCWLNKTKDVLPHVLFLDMNMPRKRGVECLAEIRLDEKLKQLPVVIFSTSFDKDLVDQMYDSGANYYLRKPNDFSKLKKIIHHALTLMDNKDFSQSKKENFILQS